jgi:hypothetical protein
MYVDAVSPVRQGGVVGSTGVIEDAVVKVLAERYRRVRLELEFPPAWEVEFVVSDEVGFRFEITDFVLQRFFDLGFTHETTVDAVVTFIFRRVEHDLGYDEDDLFERLPC